MADTGAILPGTGADDASYGTITWSNPTRITADDASYADALTIVSYTHYLSGTNFGFAIPAGSTINGIQLDVRRYKSAGAAVHDGSIRLLKAGAVTGDDKMVTDTWPTSVATKSYGGAIDLWNAAWTVADINGSTFGAVVAAHNASYSTSAYVDWIKITIYYTLSGVTFCSEMCSKFDGEDFSKFDGEA